MGCHPEPFASLKGKLREGSLSMGSEMLRFAQHDNTDSEACVARLNNCR